MSDRYGAGDNVEEMIGSLLREGVVIIESLMTSDIVDSFCADLRAEFDREGHFFQNDFNGHTTLRVGGVAAHSQQFEEFFTHPSYKRLRVLMW